MTFPLLRMTAPATLRRLFTDTPFLLEGVLAAMLREGSPDPFAAEHPILKAMREKLRPQIERAGDLAIVPVSGALARRPDPFEMAWGDFEDTDAIRGLVDQAASDADVSGILLDVDSPGGFYTGGPELADAIRSAGRRKPLVAWTGGQMASLAYWVGSQAHQVVASRSAAVGSIGVFIALYDVSKLFDAFGVKVELFKNREGALKAAGLPGTSLSDAQREHFQERAQAAFEEFRKTVLAARPDVPASAMRGQTFTGAEAKGVGLVDRVGDRAFALSVLRSLSRERSGS